MSEEASPAVSAQQKKNKEPTQDLQCIWMMAGVLNHKICDRQYDCEHCELDQVLRRIPKQMTEEQGTGGDMSEDYFQHHLTGNALEDQVNQCLSQIVSGSKIYLDRCYSPSHFWLYPESQETVSIGGDLNMLKLLYPISEVHLPDPDTSLKQNQMCALIVRGELTIPLYAPFSGRVVETNHQYAKQLGNSIPDSDQWLFKMAPLQPIKSIDNICSGEQMLKWYVHNIHLIKRYIRNAFSRTAISEIGPTMADGGEVQLNLEIILGTEPYNELIREVFQIS